MKKNFIMQILSFAVLFAFLCMPLTTNAQGSKANFAGTWAFNAEKSNMGDAPQGGGLEWAETLQRLRKPIFLQLKVHVPVRMASL